MIYMVDHIFADPALEPAWHEWYAGYLRKLVSVPGIHTAQRFKAIGHTPSRYLAMGFGNVRYPVMQYKRDTYRGADLSVKDGGRQIEYDDEDPRVLAMFEQELSRRGIESQMNSFVGAR